MGRNENDPNAPMRSYRIEKIFKRTAYHLRILTIRSSSGQVQILLTTNEHPVYHPETGWTAAGKLTIGQQILEPFGGLSTIEATRYEAHPEGIEVFNLRVAEAHTYLVRADGFDGEPVWVHNAYDPDLAAQNQLGRYGRLGTWR